MVLAACGGKGFADSRADDDAGKADGSAADNSEGEGTEGGGTEGERTEGESCQPETDHAFCTRLGKNCGEAIDFDNCEASRTVVCGACTAPETCGGGGAPSRCGCTPDCADKCGGIADGCAGTCTASCGSGKLCQGQTCAACGVLGQPCCDGGSCTSGACGGGGTPNVCADGWYDSASALTWKINPAADTMSWQAAMDYCTSLEGDWQLPTISELRSLVRGCARTQTGGSCGVTDSCLDDLSCRNSDCEGCNSGAGPDGGCYWPSQMDGACDWYWSASLLEDDTLHAWYVDFYHVYVYSSGINLASYVRCVRYGP